jgi:RNA polymerase sigma-70 factor (ECF subfamily)
MFKINSINSSSLQAVNEDAAQPLNFQELYNTYSKMVFNLALQYVQNVEDAEEIAQDVFVSIHQSLESFRGEANISTFIYRIAINKSLDFIKAKKRKKRFAFISALFFPDSNEVKHEQHEFNHPGVLMEQDEATRRIFKYINELPENQKTALILSKIEHKSQKEIAEIMELNVKAVESLIQRAKVNLQKKLLPGEGN